MTAAAPPDIAVTLAPVRLRLGLAALQRRASNGLLAGALAALLILAANALSPFSLAVPACLTVLALGLLSGIAVGLLRWPTYASAARLVDRRFALGDRVTTALQFQHSPAVLASLQRLDAARAVSRLSISAALPLRPSRHEAAGPLAAAAVLALLLVGTLTEPSQARRPGNQTANIRRVASVRLPALEAKLHRALTARERRSLAVRRLDQALGRLQRQLLHSTSRASALRAISATQQSLQQLAQPLRAANGPAAGALHRWLDPYLSSRQGGAQQGSTTLEKLAAAAASAPSAQRQALARALRGAAGATADPALRSLLQRAAAALPHDPAAAGAALRQAATSAAGSPQVQAESSQLKAANAQLEALKSDISGVGQQASGPRPNVPADTGGRAGESPQQSLQHFLQGRQGMNGSRPGLAGHSAGNGGGTGAAAASSRGRGAGSIGGAGGQGGRGQGAGSGRSGAGGQGAGGHGTLGSRGSVRYVRVYVPGVQGSGPNSVQSGPSGAPTAGHVIPYRLVMARYSASARLALDRIPLPPTLQNYVRAYFSAISH